MTRMEKNFVGIAAFFHSAKIKCRIPKAVVRPTVIVVPTSVLPVNITVCAVRYSMNLTRIIQGPVLERTQKC